MGELKLIYGRQVRHCQFLHVMPSWWPRLVIAWSDPDSIRPDVYVNACVRHTQRAFAQLRYMGTPSKVNPQREAEARMEVRAKLGMLLCDGCYQAATGCLALCAEGCAGDLNHAGQCSDPDAGIPCAWCGDDWSRLHVTAPADITRPMPTVGEHDEGQWFLNWPGEQQGPYADARDAWDAWHSASLS